MMGWLRRLFGRPTATDPVSELERERRLAEAGRDRDRMQDEVLATDGRYVTRGGTGGVLPPPRDEWPSEGDARR
jgi:hypothetical protein